MDTAVDGYRAVADSEEARAEMEILRAFNMVCATNKFRRLD
jgi:hypothetical protein